MKEDQQKEDKRAGLERWAWAMGTTLLWDTERREPAPEQAGEMETRLVQARQGALELG